MTFDFDDYDDDLDGCRGMLLGLLTGIALWTATILLLLWWLR